MATVTEKKHTIEIDEVKIGQIIRGITFVFMMELGIRIPTDDEKGNIKFSQTIGLLNEILHEELDKIINQTSNETQLDKIVPYYCFNPYGILTIDPVTNKYIVTKDELCAVEKDGWKSKQYHYPIETKLDTILNWNMCFIFHDGIDRDFLKSILPLIVAINPEPRYYPTNHAIEDLAPVIPRGYMTEKQFKTAMKYMQLENIVVPPVCEFLPYFLKESKLDRNQVIIVNSVPLIKCERYGIGWEKQHPNTDKEVYDMLIGNIKELETVDKVYIEHTVHMFPDDETRTNGERIFHGFVFGVTRKIKEEEHKEEPNALYFDEPI